MMQQSSLNWMRPAAWYILGVTVADTHVRSKINEQLSSGLVVVVLRLPVADRPVLYCNSLVLTSPLQAPDQLLQMAATFALMLHGLQLAVQMEGEVADNTIDG